MVYLHEGVGEIRLLLPALAYLTQREAWVAWIGPPHLPYAPALVDAGLKLTHFLLIEPKNEEERRWAIERCLEAPDCGATVFWEGPRRLAQWRRWQQAVERGGGLGFWLHAQPAGEFPPALRLGLAATEKGGVAVQILKRRHGWPTGPVHLLDSE